jgi:hypothetical protein
MIWVGLVGIAGMLWGYTGRPYTSSINIRGKLGVLCVVGRATKGKHVVGLIWLGV